MIFIIGAGCGRKPYQRAGRFKNGAKLERTGARHLLKLGENAKAAQKKREAEGLDLHLFAGKLPVDDDGAARGKAVLHKFFAERTAHPASSCCRDARMMWRGRAVTGAIPLCFMSGDK